MLRYFAYGSNMLPKQMAERCPGAQLMGQAELKGWRFLITKRGTANIVPAKDSTVHGALWSCAPKHIHTLDKFEGVSIGIYLRRFVRVNNDCQTDIPALVYWSPRHLPGPARTDYLHTAVLPGAKQLGLSVPYISDLQGWSKTYTIGWGRSRYKGRTK